MVKKIIMGIDHGNGYVKAVSDDAKILRPSEYADPSDVRQNVMSADRRGKQALHTFEVGRYGNETVVWGDDIHKVANSLATLATVDRYKQREYQILSDVVLASLLPKDLESGIAFAMVVTGCPSSEHGTVLEEDLAKVFKGGHHVVIDGHRQAMINVTDVMIVPQPLGSVLYYYLDDDGYVKDESFESAYVGVIDIGSGTTDIDGINELEREPKDTDTFEIGIQTAYQEIADAINEKDVTAKATGLLVKRQLAAGKLESYEVNKNYTIDITEIADKMFRSLARRIIASINGRWRTRSKFDKILLTGGGAAIKPIAAEFKKWHAGIVVVKNSQDANAVGFYRYGKFLARAEESENIEPDENTTGTAR